MMSYKKWQHAKLSITKWHVEELEKVLKYHADEYKSQNNRLINLDQKAQHTATISGVFIAATLAFLNAKDFGTLLKGISPYVVCLFETSIGLLLLSVMFCVKAMLVKEFRAPLSPQSIKTLLDDVAKIKEINQNYETADSLTIGYLKELIKEWKEPVEKIEDLNKNKANDVYIGQLLLCIALVCVSIFIVIIINTNAN